MRPGNNSFPNWIFASESYPESGVELTGKDSAFPNLATKIKSYGDLSRSAISKSNGVKNPVTKEPLLPRVTMVLCHNNSIVSDIMVHGKIPGKNGLDVSFTNQFISTYQTVADLRTVDFSDDDSPVYCLTYGYATKIFKQIHENLLNRHAKNVSLKKSRICVATHILVLDPWFPSQDMLFFLTLFNAIESYGCLVPNIIYVSRGPPISTAKKFVMERQHTKIMLHRSVCGDTQTFDLTTTIGTCTMIIKSAVQNQLGYGRIYVLIPDSTFEEQLRVRLEKDFAGGGWKFGTGPNCVVIVYPHMLNALTITSPDLIVAVPLIRLRTGYVQMPPDIVNAYICLTPTCLNTYGEILQVAVVGEYTPSPSDYKLTDIRSFPPIKPLQSSLQYLTLCAEQDMVTFVCQLANASIHPGKDLDSVVVAAENQNLLIRGENGSIIKLTAEGNLAVRANLSSPVRKFINEWAKLAFSPFVGMCVAVVLERALSHKPVLMYGPKETLLAKAGDLRVTDPFSHQMAIISKYIESYRLSTITSDEMQFFSGKYSVNGEAMTETIMRIKSLRSSKLFSDMSYGYFDTADLVKVLKLNKLFPTARFSSSDEQMSFYKIPGDDKLYVLMTNSTYLPPEEILVINTTKMQDTENILYRFSTVRLLVDMYINTSTS